MNIKTVAWGLGALCCLAGVAAASASGLSQGDTATDSTQRPLQVAQFLSGPTWVYYKNANRYQRLAYAGHVRIFNKFTALRFVNRSSQSIQRIDFQLTAYGDNYRPVPGADGKPVIKQLVATGPFMPGAEQTLVNSNVVWSLPPGYGLGCVLLSGMQIVYADGTSQSVTGPEVEKYLAPTLTNKCGIPPGQHAGAPDGWVGPSPNIAGVYPAKWMILHEHETLYLQPFVAPGAAQHLCAVGSIVEEACVHPAGAAAAEDAR